MSKGAFPKTSNEDDDDVLSTFAFICMLGFDVYVKKLMIETLIDSKNNNKTQKEKETKMMTGSFIKKSVSIVLSASLILGCAGIADIQAKKAARPSSSQA